MASGLDQWLGKLEGHNEIGEALTNQLQKAEDEVQQFIGGQTALKLSVEKVGALGAVVEQDLNDGKLNFDSELKAAEYAKKMVIRAREVLLNLADGAKSREIAAAGKVSALKESREVVLKHTLAARARAEQLRAAEIEARKAVQESLTGPDSGSAEAEEPPKQPRQPRASGHHPGHSSLDERRAEAARERAEATSADAHPSSETTPEPMKKRRGRPPKVKRG